MLAMAINLTSTDTKQPSPMTDVDVSFDGSSDGKRDGSSDGKCNGSFDGSSELVLWHMALETWNQHVLNPRTCARTTIGGAEWY